ncbi:MAG: WYL domain-containing protein [Oscillospiraceae bacterium]|nr:WYL domain-containing protein [Oscillospiraceae bacterium]
MSAGDNQKLKMLYLVRIFSEETDDQHGLTLQEIAARLERFGVNADRKTLYKDFAELEKFGLEILSEQDGRTVRYHLASRQFELPELKLLVDVVQGSKFITEKKSRQLIKKLESLASVHEARQLHRQVLITGRIKTMNESIYYLVDMLHEAINADRQIRFQYYRWNVRRQPELRRGGAWYQLSPWCLLWDDENYYLVAYDAADGRLKHFRVDKIVRLSVTDAPREGKAAFQKLDPATYTRSVFGMFGGELTRVTLEGRADMVGPLIDRFGTDITIVPHSGDRFTASVDVAVSRHFLGWIIALGDGVRVTGPQALLDELREEARRLAALYNASPSGSTES